MVVHPENNFGGDGACRKMSMLDGLRVSLE
jgi:hypothetical protein